MNRQNGLFGVVVGLMCVTAALPALLRAEVTLAVRGKTVYTMAGPPITDGVVLIEGRRIGRVGPAEQVAIPEGMRVLSAEVVTPGLIDARTIVGLQGYENEARENDLVDKSAPFQPELRAVDAFNARERLLEWIRGFGVTTIHTGPSPEALSTGRTIIIKTAGPTVEDGLLKADAMVCITLGPDGLMKDAGGKSPGTRAKQIAMLRQELIKAGEYDQKRRRAASQPATIPAEGETGDSAPRDLRLEVLVEVLNRKTPLLVTAERAQDIVLALKLKEEFGLEMVLDLADEAYLLLDRIKQAGVPILVHPTMKRATGDSENLSMETAAKLRESGIPFAFQSGYESYVPKTRVVLFEAAIAMAHGLKFEDTLAALTIESAKILGVSDRVGSIETGKDADLALYNGDPFEYTTHCTGTIIDGNVVFEGRR
jgi:imidazolonepropionase-like amidohydrolase